MLLLGRLLLLLHVRVRVCVLQLLLRCSALLACSLPPSLASRSLLHSMSVLLAGRLQLVDASLPRRCLQVSIGHGQHWP